ncbi:MAG: DNA-binding protein [Rhodospirillaceae bacterium]|nr:MAG: DNA-binding protein [Rhodospirillaceae bacterium TMED63]RZO37652.1 MAG: DNA-binding protein [Rhodospirillaceae bacterium]|tara:strand:- start:5 stop:235 length:231 start_codon:yes stop_codon:yes gene_type:complete
MKRGLPVEEAAYILNVSKNYVYRLLREEKLEVVGDNPITVSSKSVVRRLISLQPFLEYAVPSRLDYAVKQHEVQGW